MGELAECPSVWEGSWTLRAEAKEAPGAVLSVKPLGWEPAAAWLRTWDTPHAAAGEIQAISPPQLLQVFCD